MREREGEKEKLPCSMCSYVSGGSLEFLCYGTTYNHLSPLTYSRFILSVLERPREGCKYIPRYVDMCMHALHSVMVVVVVCVR